MGSTRYIGALLLASLAALGTLPAGCGRETTSPGRSRTAELAGAPVERTAQAGPVVLTLRAARDNVPYTQRARLTIEARAPATATLRLDDYLSRLKEAGAGGFEYRALARGSTVAEPTRDNQRRWTQTFDLEFFLPGQYELPGAAAYYVLQTPSPETPAEAPPSAPQPSLTETTTTQPAKGPARSTPTPAPEEQQLTTEPLTLTAVLPPGQNPSQEEMAKLTMPAPVELPPDPFAWKSIRWLVIGVAAFIVVALALWLAMRRRHRRAGPAAPLIPPAEWALAELEKLLAERLLEGDNFRAFYYRLNELVRQYVERGFDVAAPEQTTEEFFDSVRAELILGPEEKHSFGRFLTACDMVKYARHQPVPDEASEVLSTARSFIERTAERTRFLAARTAAVGPLPEGGQAAPPARADTELTIAEQAP